ncbi:Lipin/Ned1/Smp2-domain-containing protein [Xylariales sp. AK1849]|nr:Lipin/Ned1/Smp2-domain-containing protein [Xylariales sp. AK1849]
MQYVRNISNGVSTAWNSINPSTLSGAIDVIVVEQDDGTLACSPFHVRFGKFSLLRPYEKKVEFKVNGQKQEYAMKLGEGGEAFFVFETTDNIPQSLQTSPLVSPASSPPLDPAEGPPGALQEPDLLQLDSELGKPRSSTLSRPGPAPRQGLLTPHPTSPELVHGRPLSRDWLAAHKVPSHSEDLLPSSARAHADRDGSQDKSQHGDSHEESYRSTSPPPLAPREALLRAVTVSDRLSAVNIPSHITETGDLMLDMTGYKSSEEDAIKAEISAREILAKELQGDYDIGALFGMDEQGNLWIYSSEDAKDAAMKKTVASLQPSHAVGIDAVSDPGYASDDSRASTPEPSHRRSESDTGQMSVGTPPTTPGISAHAGDPNRNYAKTLRLTSDQLKELNLKPGENTMAFTVNRATCQANMYLWRFDTPVVISDIDGTITKSDALGQVLNMIGRDWTHAGVAKLYNDIVANGYNIMYLTSRSVGQADTTRAYLNGILQDNYRLPRGPTILSPDRTMAALRREIYLRKPHVFKMATLRDIRNLYGPDRHCFYAGFGNRLTDQISYRTVDVPRNRIFTINSNAEVSLDLLSLNKLKLSYVNMTEVVDHYFPPVSTLIKGGGEQYTDFTYWRDTPLDMDQFSASEDEGDRAAVEEDEDEDVGNMGDSYLSRGDDDDAGESILSGSGIYEDEQHMMDSMMQDEEDADDEDDDELEEDEGLDDDDGTTTQSQSLSVPHEAEPKSKPSTPKITVPDIDAEIMTGLSHLGMEKELEEAPTPQTPDH